MSEDTWIGTITLADLLGVSRQAAHKAVKRRRVRGCAVLTRVEQGALGQGGLRFEVALSSLPEAVQRAFWDGFGNDFQGDHATALIAVASPVVGCGYVPAPNQSERVNRVYRIIQEALDAPRGSPERKVEVLRAAKKWSVGETTIYRWLRDHEAAGGDSNSFARRRPSDAGRRRVSVSREFDAAWIEAGHDPAELPALGDAIDHQIKRAWASSAQRAGQSRVRKVAIGLFRRDLAARGIELPASAFQISDRRIKAPSEKYRLLDVRENDRKRWDDMKPRITRDATGLEPMAIVVMDVKPLDNIVRRADGTTAWPKMIAFQDWGTHRVFRYFVLLAKGEGVRQEHVVDAFMAMVSHPDWGFPQQLYRDNGSEFAVFDKIRDALALINDPNVRTIVNAKPYSGASKPIESKFASLDRAVFSQMMGWAGGNRLDKKTQTVGKPPAPYHGSFEDFVREADYRIADYENDTIGSGAFEGRSPAGWFAAKLEAGWRAVRVDPLALEASFARHETRRVDRGAVSIGGQLFRHPELPNGETVTIALPYQRGSTPMVSLPGFGWASLQTDMPFLPGDIAGAVEAGRMQQRSERAARGLRRTVAPIAPTEALAPNVVALPGRASRAPLIDLAMSEEAKSFAGARIEAASKEAEEQTEAEQAKARRKRLVAMLGKKYASGK